MVARTREYVYAGDIFQANLSQRLDGIYALPSLHLYQTLRAVNPSPFAGYLHFGDYELISSSPERLVSLDRDGWAETRPMAGTRPRGDRRPEDDALTEELNLDPKERAEHIMLVDLERNDLGKVCEYGTVRVSELMVNEYYSHVIQIVSNVRGHLHPAATPSTSPRPCSLAAPSPAAPRCAAWRSSTSSRRCGEARTRAPSAGSQHAPSTSTSSSAPWCASATGCSCRSAAASSPTRCRSASIDETLHKAAGMLRAVSAGIAERAG